jgi:hypothetical protein
VDFGDGNGPIPLFTGIHLREYQYRRHRFGFAGSADYRIGKASSAYIRGLFADFRDFGDTWNTELNPDQVSPTSSAPDGYVQLRHLNRTPQQKIFSIAVGENLNLGRYLLNYQVAVSRSRQDGQFPTPMADSMNATVTCCVPSPRLLPPVAEPTLIKMLPWSRK